MNIFSLLAFLSFFICLYLGIYIYRVDPKVRLNQVFLILCLTFAIWAFSDVFLYPAPTREAAWMWFAIASLGWGSFGGLFLHLFLILTGKEQRKWWFYTAIYLPGIFFTFITFAAPQLYGIDFIKGYGGWCKIALNGGSIWFWAYATYYSLCISISVISTWQWGKKSIFLREKRQANIIILTCIPAVITCSITDIILPVFKPVIPPIASVTILIWIGGLWFAIIKFKLMTLTSAIASEEILTKVMDLIVLVNPDGVILRINKRSQKLLGYKSQELNGKHFSSIVFEEEAFKYKFSKMQDYLLSDSSCEMKYKTKAGKIIPVSTSCSSIKDKAGDLIGVVVIGQDLRTTKQLQQEISERKQAEKELQESTTSLRNILNNAGQGFMLFGEDLFVDGEYSLECVSIFGFEIENYRFPELIYPNEVEPKDFLENLLTKILNEKNEAKRDIYLPLLPDEVTVSNRCIHVDYKIILDDVKEDAKEVFMVILTDITDKRLLENRIEQEKNILKMVVKVVVNYNDFIDIVKDYQYFYQSRIREVLSSGLPMEDTVFEIFRDVHTFKGSFSQLETVNIVNKLHEFESAISDMKKNLGNMTRDDLMKFFSEFKPSEWLDEDFNILKGILGENYFNRENVFVVDKMKLMEIEKKMVSTLSPYECKQLLPDIRRLRYKPFKELLKSSPDYTAKLSERMEKLITPLEIEGGDELVDIEKYSDFAKSLVHVFRNSIDHGIESMDERIEIGKDECGSIKCNVKVSNNKISVTISDDGRGIDVEKIRKKAVEKGLYDWETVLRLYEDEVIYLVFEDEFTTKDEITELSGRGIGLAAVKGEVDRLGGTVKVNTKVGVGTEFQFTLPYEDITELPRISISDIMNPLADSVKKFLTEQIGVTLRDFNNFSISKEDKLSLRRVSAFINMKGFLSGRVIISIDEELAKKFVQSFVIDSDSLEEGGDYTEDVLIECSNIIVGNSVKMFSLYEDLIMIDSPVTIYSEGTSMKYPDSDIWTCIIKTSSGNLNLSLITSEGRLFN